MNTNKHLFTGKTPASGNLSSLIVPIQIDALHLKSETVLAGAPLDFTKVPFFNGERDINADRPYLASELKPKAIGDNAFYATGGIHLHWALPDALTQMRMQNDNTVNYFCAPNRWLLSRMVGGKIDKRWLVFSDYLFPKKLSTQRLPIVAYPINEIVKEVDGEKEYKQFRYMGNAWDLEQWNRISSDELARMEFLSQSANPLTPFGYGSPDFHAYYPSCHSLFGFKDIDYRELPESDELAYTLVGWHDNPGSHDPLSLLKAEAKANGLASTDYRLDFIKQELKWACGGDGVIVPARTLYIGKVVLKKSTEFSNTPQYYDRNIDQARPKISIGNTRSEALISHLANYYDPDQKAAVEQHLESIYYQHKYQHSQLDEHYKFEEARHTSGFKINQSDREWVLRKKLKNTSVTAQQANEADSNFIDDHPDIAKDLQQLNEVQIKYDKALQKMKRDRTQLYADWYKYMHVAYPDINHYLSDRWKNNELRTYLERQLLWPYLYEQMMVGPALAWNADAQKLEWKDPAKPGGEETIAGQLMTAYKAAQKVITAYNKTVKQSDQQFWLLSIASQSYWEPLAPAIMLSGPGAEIHTRNGEDGSNQADGCLPVWSSQALKYQIKANPLDSLTSLDRIIADNLKDFNVQDRNPWTPHLLEFEVQLQSLSQDQAIVSQANPYKSDHITSNYALINKRPDFTPINNKAPKSGPIIRGRSLLTKGMHENLLDRSIRYLCNRHFEHFIPPDLSPADTAKLKPDLKRWFEKTYLPVVTPYRGTNPAPLGQLYVYVLDSAFNERPCIDMQGQLIHFDQLSLAEQERDHFNILLKTNQRLDDFESLSTTLTHFNWALLQFEEGWQLPIEDPLGFENEQQFTALIRNAIGDGLKLAPRFMDKGFSPIRDGLLQFRSLRILDTFGQTLDISKNPYSVGHSMAIPKESRIPKTAIPFRPC